MNLNKDVDRSKLFKAMDASYQKMEWNRDLNKAMVSASAGSAYGPQDEAGEFETILYLMRQAADATTMSLAANSPVAMIETNRPELTFFAKHSAVALNNLLAEIRIAEVIQRWVADAFYSGLGTMYLHQGDTAASELWDGIWIDPGTPMASNVAPDDRVWDMSATRWDQVKYEAHSYRLPIEDLEDDRFEQKVVKELRPSPKAGFSGWSDRTESLSKGYESDADDLIPMVDVMDVWIPREKRIYTFAMDPQSRFSGRLGPLCTMDWDGPEWGPYPKLTFLTVPENLIGLSLAAQMATLARLANNLMRKQMNQADRQKEITIYTPAAADDFAKIKSTPDGGSVCVRDLSEIGKYETGGVNAANMAFLESAVQKFDRFAGNLPAKLGLGSQANTLGQEEMIQGQVMATQGQLQLRLHDATRELVRGLWFMLWHDAAKRMPGRLDVPNVPGATVDATWTPEFRMGRFDEYSLSIDVHSMGYRPPQQKFADIVQLVTQVYAPLAPVFLQQGGQIDMQEFTEAAAEALQNPRIKRIFNFAAPRPGEQPDMPQSAGGMPTQTTRNYVRQDSPNPANANQAASPEEWLSMAQQPAQGGVNTAQAA